MKLFNKILIITCLMLGVCLADDFNVTLTNFRSVQNDLVDLEVVQTRVDQLLGTITVNGSWPDISYESSNGSSNVDSSRRGEWQPLRHAENFLMMSITFVNSNSSAPGNSSDDLLAKTLLAFDFWMSSNLTAPDNYTEYRALSSLVAGALLLQENLNQSRIDLLNSTLSEMNVSDDANRTLSNQMFVNEFILVKSLFLSDNASLSTYFNQTWQLVHISNSTLDGIKVDGTFYFNGQLIHNGNVGARFATDVLKAMVIANGTSFVATNETMDVWSNFMLNGSQWMAFYNGNNSYWNPQVVQYLITRKDGTKFSIPTDLLLKSPVHSSEFKDWVDYLTGDSNSTDSSESDDDDDSQEDQDKRRMNRQYWFGDYMVHSRGNYSVSLKFHSSRTFNTECYLGDGLPTTKMSDGSFFLQNIGSTYSDSVYPLFNWDLIPGVTTDMALNKTSVANMTCDESVRHKGLSDFAGSVSDGEYGAAAFNLMTNHSAVTGKKSWFFFEEHIVLLGFNISRSGNNNNNSTVVTAIDQRMADGDIFTSGSDSRLDGNQTEFSNITWFHHDRVGVYFPKSPASNSLNIHIGVENKTGRWEDIGSSSGNVTGQLFTAYQTHPNQSSEYQMIVIPDVDVQEFNSTVDGLSESIIILNTDDIQAVAHFQLNLVQAVFWRANASLNITMVNHNFKLSPSSPCIVQVKFLKVENDRSNSIAISISDPTQKLSNITMASCVQLTGPNATYDPNTKGSTIVFTLPSGDFSGSTLTQIYTIGGDGGSTTGNPTTGNPTTTSSTTNSPFTTGSQTTSSNPTTGNPTTGNPTTNSPFTTGSQTTSSNPTTGTPTTTEGSTTCPDGAYTDNNGAKVTTTVDVTTTSSSIIVTPSLTIIFLVIMSGYIL
ncbi:hypothetical protein PPL_05317 [Heterostelium album PN500]|uniref:Uncharacterized protein n=1 Tax=Heterostelium pallidum (strain ATCC 26659 / Pp 5 / PN500) TaxID=670386 RepID=D3BBC7_HETP5|nr:hypothetical protein PPL_05317 [Heterostelium album PN500]EFA81334.1 hypothetical protein PPL_05317 [Heterostelium album PN500]|eukprot:XP_020433452.1 hypothetical protein PPL_05317 [Heterostelium album PN500]